MIGLVMGYIFAERQSGPAGQGHCPPRAPGQSKVCQWASSHRSDRSGVGRCRGGAVGAASRRTPETLAQAPNDPRLMVALGNLYFDAGRWTESRLWYERAIEAGGGDPNVFTDLAVVYRNLKQPERSLDFWSGIGYRLTTGRRCTTRWSCSTSTFTATTMRRKRSTPQNDRGLESRGARLGGARSRGEGILIGGKSRRAGDQKLTTRPPRILNSSNLSGGL